MAYRPASSCSSSMNSSTSSSSGDVEVVAEEMDGFSSPTMGYSMSSSVLGAANIVDSANEQSATLCKVEMGAQSSHRKPKLSFSIEALIGIK